VAAGNELSAHLAVVIDLAIEGDPNGTVFVRERLVATGKIDDAESPVAEPDIAVNGCALVVRAAMDHRVQRGLQVLPVDRRESSEVEDPANAAHEKQVPGYRCQGPVPSWKPFPKTG